MRIFRIFALLVIALCFSSWALAGRVFIKTFKGEIFSGDLIACKDGTLVVKIPFGKIRVPVARVEFISKEPAKSVPAGLVLSSGEVLPVTPSDLISFAKDEWTFKISGQLKTLTHTDFESVRFMIMEVRTTSGRTYFGEVTSYSREKGLLNIITVENRKVSLPLSEVESVTWKGSQNPPYGLLLKGGVSFFVTRLDLVGIKDDQWVFNLLGKPVAFYKTDLRSLRFYPGRYLAAGKKGYWEYVSLSSEGVVLERLGEKVVLKPSEVIGIEPVHFWKPSYRGASAVHPLCVEFVYGGKACGEVSFRGGSVTIRCGAVEVMAYESAIARISKPTEDVEVGYFKAVDPDTKQLVTMGTSGLLGIENGKILLGSPYGTLEVPYGAFRALRLRETKTHEGLTYIKVGDVEIYTDTVEVEDRAFRLLEGRLLISNVTKYIPVTIWSGKALSRLGKPVWRFKTGANVDSSPAVGADGTIYVGSDDGYLYAISPGGDIKWKFKTGGEVYSSPAIGADRVVYVGSEDGYLYAINPDGTLKWRFKTDSSVYSSPTVGADGVVYVGSDDGYLYAIGPNGKLRWRFKTGGGVYSSPAIGADGTIYVGSDDGYLYAIGPNGKLRWRFKTGSYLYSSPAIGPDGVVYVGSDDGCIYAVNTNGTLRWKLKTSGGVYSSPVVGPDGTVYVGSYGYVYAVDPNGTLKWKFKTEGYVYSAPVVGSNGTVYVGGLDYYLYAIGPDGNLRWKLRTGGCIYSSPVVDENAILYVGSRDGYLYAVQTDSIGVADSPWPCFKGSPVHTGRCYQK